MNVIATLQSIDFKVAATAKSCGKVKVSHAAVKSFDRHGVSCKNARTVQFSGGEDKVSDIDMTETQQATIIMIITTV